MKTAAFAVLALLCLQAAAASSTYGEQKPVYEPKQPVYVQPAVKPVYVAPSPVPVYVAPSPVPVYVAPSPVPSPEPIVETITCTPKPVIVSAAATATCATGYTLTQTPKGATCQKQVCVLVAPQPVTKPVYEPKKPVYQPTSTGYYFFGKTEQKPVYEPKQPVYVAPAAVKPVYVAPVAVKPVYVAPSPSPVPSPVPVPVCHIEYADPIYVCEAGYTLSSQTCTMSTPGVCPPTYTATNGVCVYTYTVQAKPVYAPAKPVYKPTYSSQGNYFFGKKLDFFKKSPSPAGPSYCAASLYAKPSPVVVKPVYQPKPVYKPKTIVIDPKAIAGKVLSTLGKHD